MLSFTRYFPPSHRLPTSAVRHAAPPCRGRCWDRCPKFQGAPDGSEVTRAGDRVALTLSPSQWSVTLKSLVVSTRVISMISVIYMSKPIWCTPTLTGGFSLFFFDSLKPKTGGGPKKRWVSLLKASLSWMVSRYNHWTGQPGGQSQPGLQPSSHDLPPLHQLLRDIVLPQLVTIAIIDLSQPCTYHYELWFIIIHR